MKKRSVRNHVLPILLSMAVVLSSGSFAALADSLEENGKKEIIVLEELPSSISNQVVIPGTGREDLSLPGTLKATIMTASSEDASNYASPGNAKKIKQRTASPSTPYERNVRLPVDWDSSPVYDKEEEGTYLFTPRFPAGYNLAAGVDLPEVSVTVQADSNRINRLDRILTDWSYTDQSNLSNGKLLLAGVGSEMQADVKTIVTLLPDEVSGNLEGEDDPVKVSITEWVCQDYVMDSLGNWPITGTYLFRAVMEDGYQCAPEPVIEVILGGINMLAASGDLTVTGGVPGSDYVYQGGVLTVKTNTPLTISGQTTADRIMVKSAEADITLKNLSITSSNNRPFDMEGADVTLHLVGNNSLKSPINRAALFCPSGSRLTIEGPGKLTATIHDKGGAAAIGGESKKRSDSSSYRDWEDGGDCGVITINGGEINAEAPILADSNANVGVAIGGSSGGPVIINGGTVNAIGEHNSVGIGSVGSEFDGIYIRGGKVTAKTKKGDPLSDTPYNSSLGPAIGVVSGIDFTIEITGGTVSAESNPGCAGIGGGRNGYGGNIYIGGKADVTAKGNFGAAGIGGGYAQNGGGCGRTIVIEGNAVVKAYGGIHGAGIGGGAPRNNGDSPDGYSGSIMIAGNAHVTARGGEGAPGIGSGGTTNGIFEKASIVEKIVITGNPVVDAKGGTSSACDIGPGALPSTGAANPSPEERFEEFICTVPGITTQTEAKNSLTILSNGNYKTKGRVTLDHSLTIPSGKSLIFNNTSIITGPVTIPDGAVIESGTVKDSSGNTIAGGVSAFTLTVSGGTGNSQLTRGESTRITASVPAGKRFDQWQITSGDGSIADIHAVSTIFTMGGANTVVTAVFKKIDTTAVIKNVKVLPSNTTVQKGSVQQFSAVVEGTGDFNSDVTWKVTGASSSTIDSNGLLTVPKDENADSFTVQAISVSNPLQLGTSVVTVTDRPVTRYHITVNGGTGSGDYESGSVVQITAVIPSGKLFSQWNLAGDGIITDSKSASTYYTVGRKDTLVTAVFKDIKPEQPDDNSGSGNSGSQSGGSSSSENSAGTGRPGSNVSGGYSGPGSVQNVNWILEERGWRIKNTDQTWVANSWREVKGIWYHFDAEGYMQTGWYTDLDGNQYYLSPADGSAQGSMAIGWWLIEDKWYYFNKESDGTKGKLLRNTVTPDGYSVGTDGVWIEE